MKLKNNFKKVVLAFFIGILVFSISLKANASSFRGSIIYEYRDKEHLGAGILYEDININSTKGLWDINVIRIDLKNEYTELKGLINPEGLHYRDTVTNMVNKHNAIAGINGDYFNYSPEPSAMGTLINDGKVISSPIERAYALPTIYIDQNKDAKIEYFDRHIMVRNLRNNAKIHVNTYNKATKNFDTLTILDRNWGYKSIGTKFHRDLVEVVVDNGIVKDIRIGKPAVDIPQNGYIIAGRGGRATPLKSLQVGDKLDLEVGTTPNLENIKFAIGGGSVILRDGKITNTNIVDYGRHPRTGIGINKENTEMILVTVDGRSRLSHGMTQGEFSQLMSYLGAHDALNLDGGGSTTMAIRKPGEDKAKLANKPSDGGQRKVVNSVGVYSKAPEGVLNRIQIRPESNPMFKNTTNKISVIGLDGYNKEVPINQENINLTINGTKKDLENGILEVEETGNYKIVAEYTSDGKTYKDEINLKVVGEVVHLESELKVLEVEPGKTYNFKKVTGTDIHGNKGNIPIRDLDIQMTEGLGTIEDCKFISSEEGMSGYISLILDKGATNIEVKSTINPEVNSKPLIEESTFQDIKYKKSPVNPENGFKVSLVGIPHNLRYQPRVNMVQSALNSSDIVISLNGFNQVIGGGVTKPYKITNNAGYREDKRGDLYMVTVDSRNASIRTSNWYQWMHLKHNLLDREESNILISTQTPLSQFKDQNEARALKDIAQKLQESGKNVFLVQGGTNYSTKLENGVRYITLDSRVNKDSNALSNFHILEFVVNGNDVTYSFIKPYP